jgi:murein DD-endopeptidase MepM/ murein hydrolase activator NlpD
MAFNQQNLTSALNGLEATVERILSKVTGSKVQGPMMPGQTSIRGSSNFLNNSLASFASATPERTANMVQSGGQTVSGLSQMMPDVQATVQRAGTFYNATLRAGGGMSRPEMQQATLEGMRGGLTSPGSDAMVGGYLAQRGMFASTKFSSNYQQTIRSVGNAAKYLNMDNATAATSLANLTSGRGASSLLNRYGLFTADTATGEKKSQGQIFEEMAQRLTVGQEAATVEETMDSLYGGFLGEELAASGMDEAGQQMMASYMIERAKGNNMDLSDPEAMQELMDKAKAEGNENPYLPGYDLNTAKTDAMGGAEGSYLAGIKAATKALEGLTKAGGALASVFGFMKSGTSTFMGDPVGQGFMDVVGGVAGFFGVGSNSGDNVVGNASAAAKGAQIMSGGAMGGGSAPGGFGGGSSSHPIGGETSTSNASAEAGAPQAFKLVHPVSSPKITATFGQKKSSFSGEIVWPNGHKGVDYAAKQGDTIFAAADGEVMPTEGGGQLGSYVKIKHDNGMYTFYAHLSSVAVRQGRVKQGQPVGGAGNTGTKSFGVHLHFALSTSATTANAIDPAPYMSGAASSLGVTASNPEQTSSGALPAANGETATGGSGEDTSGASLAGATNILEVTSTGYGAAGGASASSEIEGLSAASFPSANTAASTAVNGPSEGGEGYTGDDESAQVSSSGVSRVVKRPAAKAKPATATTNNVIINLTIAQASDDEAKRFARMVKQTLEEDSMMRKMART